MVYNWLNGWISEWMTDGLTHRCMDGRMNVWIDKMMAMCTDGIINYCRSELIHNDNSNNIFIAVMYSVITKEEVSDHNKKYNKHIFQ